MDASFIGSIAVVEATVKHLCDSAQMSKKHRSVAQKRYATLENLWKYYKIEKNYLPSTLISRPSLIIMRRPSLMTLVNWGIGELASWDKAVGSVTSL